MRKTSKRTKREDSMTHPEGHVALILPVHTVKKD